MTFDGRKSAHRAWSILAAGAAIQLLTGIPAAWSVFCGAVCEEYGLSPEAGMMIGSLTVAAYAPGGIAGGFVQDRAGPRTAGLAGTVLLASAFFAAPLLPAHSAWAFAAGFSLPAGTGCAFLYPAVMSCAQKWYAERKGFATGIIGCAAGLSGGVLTLLGRLLIGRYGIRQTFVLLGVLILTVCGTGAVLLADPPQYGAKRKTQKKSTLRTVRGMLAMPQYYLLAASAGLMQPAVLLFSPGILQLAQRRGLSEAAALFCVAAGSAGSAAGRLLMARLSDAIGRKKTDLLLFAALCALSVIFASARGLQVTAVYSMLTFCYSGAAALLPAFCTDLFGQENAGLCYGLTALGMSAGSAGFPLLARCFAGDAPRHGIAAAAAAAGFCVMLLIRTEKNGKNRKALPDP